MMQSAIIWKFLSILALWETTGWINFWSSYKCSDPVQFYIGKKVNSKNLYPGTFLVYFWLALKRHHISFYQPDCITKLINESFRPLSKCNLFTRNVNYYKKNLLFFTPSIRMSGKSINFDDKMIKRGDFYRNKKLFEIDDIDVNKKVVF